MNYVGIDWAYGRAAWCAIGESGAIIEEGLHPGRRGRARASRLESGHRGQGLRRDDERRDLGPRPARARRLGGRRSPTPARSETSPRSPARPTRSTPESSPTFAAATSSRRSGCPRSRTERSASAFAGARTWSRRGPRRRNRIFGLLTQFGLRISWRRLRQDDGMELLASRGVPEVWRDSIAQHLAEIEELERRITPIDRELAPIARSDQRAQPALDDPRDRPPDQPHLRRGDRRGLALCLAGEARRLCGASAADLASRASARRPGGYRRPARGRFAGPRSRRRTRPGGRLIPSTPTTAGSPPSTAPTRRSRRSRESS